jgi:hypothetical protein
LIPHPLTLLLCWFIGSALSRALGLVLQFVAELLVDAQRYGWLGDGAFTAAITGLAVFAAFAGALFIGAAMRLLADRSWPKAGAWALLAVFLASLLGRGAPIRLYPDLGLALIQSPRFFLAAPAGCFLGAYLCGRYREERWLDGAEGFIRGWMFWDRGGAL